MAAWLMAVSRRILVVFAHPLSDSLSASLKDAVAGGLADAGHDVDLIDLYQDGFDARLSAAERTAFMKPGYAPPPDAAAYCDRLKAADGIVFVFPQWWFGMPAILKGFVDRVFVPGVAFRPDPDGGRLIPLLQNIQTFDVVTTTGSPWWITELYMRNPVRRQIKQGIAGVCSKTARFRMLSMYNIDKASRADCAKFIARVRRTFSTR
ncbi:MAG: NAD(P)H dehydrogenase (quinone) [Paracoccaceae bacterium]|jgi:NAD(P)H dehydrogenase (quinone)